MCVCGVGVGVACGCACGCVSACVCCVCEVCGDGLCAWLCVCGGSEATPPRTAIAVPGRLRWTAVQRPVRKRRRADRVAFIWLRPPPPGGRAEHTPSVLMRTVGFSNGFFVIPAVADRDLGGAGLRKLDDALGLVAAARPARRARPWETDRSWPFRIRSSSSWSPLSECCARSRSMIVSASSCYVEHT